MLLVVPHYPSIRQYLLQQQKQGNDSDSDKLENSTAYLIEQIPENKTCDQFTQEEMEQVVTRVFPSKRFQSIISIEIQNACKQLKMYEKPLAWSPLILGFSQENGMMTPKLSLRRNVILQKFQHIIDAVYSDKASSTAAPTASTAPTDSKNNTSSLDRPVVVRITHA